MSMSHHTLLNPTAAVPNNKASSATRSVPSRPNRRVMPSADSDPSRPPSVYIVTTRPNLVDCA
jgi:hypothetical protein